MIDITFVIIGIVILFSIFIGLRSLSSLKICALCGAVSVSWIILLTLFYFKYEIDPVIIGLLIGGSTVGLIYILEQKLPEEYQLFKLPFYLTLISLSYFILEKSLIISTVIALSIIWLFTAVIYTGRRTKSLKELGRKIIECCKNW
jgi:hypothetical protein